MQFLVETIFGPGSATRVKLFLCPIFCSGIQRFLFLALRSFVPLEKSKDCLSSCIQSVGKTAAGHPISRVIYTGYETTCFWSVESICGEINIKFLSHDSGIIAQIKGEFLPPFVLCHKVGVTREMFQFVTSHVRAGMTISDIQVLWQQTLFDEYGLRKLCYV